MNRRIKQKENNVENNTSSHKRQTCVINFIGVFMQTKQRTQAHSNEWKKNQINYAEMQSMRTGIRKNSIFNKWCAHILNFHYISIFICISQYFLLYLCLIFCVFFVDMRHPIGTFNSVNEVSKIKKKECCCFRLLVNMNIIYSLFDLVLFPHGLRS